MGLQLSELSVNAAVMAESVCNISRFLNQELAPTYFNLFPASKLITNWNIQLHFSLLESKDDEIDKESRISIAQFARLI